MKKQWYAMGGAVLMAVLLILGCGEKKEKERGIGSEVEVVGDSTADSSSVENKIRRVSEQLRFSPTNWELYNERSQLWYESGNIPRAMSDINKAIENHITGPENYYLKGFYFYALKDDSMAQVNLQKAADLGSYDPEVYYLLGQISFDYSYLK